MMILKIALVLIIWFAISIPLGILVGKYLASRDNYGPPPVK